MFREKEDAIMSMDRRPFDSGEGPSTPKEINAREKTNDPRDMVKDASKKQEEFKHEKLKLEKAWKEHKERNEDLTRYIRTDNWEQSVDRIKAYIETFQDKELKNKIRDLSSKVLMTPSERQEHNSSPQSFQEALRKQVGYLSERSFQECLQKGNLEKAREHIENLKTINEKFQDSLVKLGIDPTAERRSIDKENQKLEQEINEIKPKDVKLSRLTQIKDALRRTHEHRPERVNNITAEFKENVKYVKEQIDGDCLPENLKEKLIEVTLSLMQDFKKFSAQAVRDYGKGSKGRQSRREGEASIDDINKRIQKIRQDLPLWEDVKEFQDSIKNPPASSSNDAISGIEQLVADKVVDDLKQAHMRVLNCCRRPSDSPLFETFLQNAHNDLKKSRDQFKILSDHSDKWERVSYNWRQVNKVQTQLEAGHGEVTEEDMRVKMLADKEINRAKEAYKEALDWYQQSDGVVFRSSVDGESQRSLEAGSLSSTLSLSELLGETISDGGPEHLHHTYKQLKEAADQLETLHEASHAWKQINEIQTEVSELNDKLSNKEVDKAKEAFKHFLDRYEQGRDGQIFKQSLERACESLKSIVEKDLREYWSEEDKFFETHFKDISKKHNNNMEIFGFEEDKPRLKHLFDESLKDKNFAQAREYINWLAEANDYLEEMKKHRLPPIPEE